MKKSLLDNLQCPVCASALNLKTGMNDNVRDDIEKGIVECTHCKKEYDIEKGIPRFVDKENYSSSFGYQWNIHVQTQVDKYNETSITSDRFHAVTGWPKNMKGLRILEAGSGAGRFTQVAVETGAEVFSLDYSNAVEANYLNNGDAHNLHILQGDIYHIPLKPEAFDRVFCLGVLQHCPDVRKAFESLVPFIKRGGEIVIDVYRKRWTTYFFPKYWFRPITRKMDKEKLYKRIKRIVPVLLPMRIGIKKIPLIGNFLSNFIPVANYAGKLPLTKQQNLEWSILDTFDMYSPAYDTPQTIEEVRQWFGDAGLVDIRVEYDPFYGLVGKGRKP